MMNTLFDVEGDQLVSDLYARNVVFLSGAASNRTRYSPPELISKLAQSSESRLRLALIPLFLQHPEYAVYAGEALRNTDEKAGLYLMCYYTAAHILQKIHAKTLRFLEDDMPNLPDLFSKQIGLPDDPDSRARLSMLAQRQGELSGIQINWLGTYQHGFERWLKPLARKHGRKYENHS